MRSLSRLALLIAALFSGVSSVAARQAAAPTDDAPRPLVAVHFDGLQRYAHDDIVRFVGLQPGQMVTEAQLTNLAQQLADTGLFTGIRYQFTTTEKGLTARFTVTEPSWTIPVIFDNFIGLSDEQLIEAVARYVPGFDGTAVADGATNNLIGTALQRVLADLGRPGRIVVIPRINVEENWTRYAFAVTDTGREMTVCAVDLPGASGAHVRALRTGIARIDGQPYSLSAIQVLTGGSLLDYYRQRGYWGARFGPPQAVLDEGCSGVSVTIPVSEGIVYRVGGVRWEGNSALATPVLDKAFAVEAGTIANLVDVEDGLLDVRHEYERIGHLLEEHTLDHELDEAAGRVTFVVRIDEGPALRMGRFEVEGLPASAAADLAARWQIQPGAIFDGTYVQRFMADHRAIIQRDDAPFMTVDVVVERATNQVHVKILPAK